jgi:hypothetical protein
MSKSIIEKYIQAGAGITMLAFAPETGGATAILGLALIADVFGVKLK